MKRFFLLLLIAGTVACSQNKSQNIAESVDSMISEDRYVEALTLLEAQEESAEVLKLKETVHLNYGLFLEYRDSNTTNMRDKMTSALMQYVEVLKINKDNEKAISEIEQILGIYSTFPDRQPNEDVMNELRELGFNV